MKKRLGALLCALLLTLSLVPAGAAWDDGLTFLAVNVNLLPLSEYMPLKINGSVYVPATVFDAATNGGVNLGIFGSIEKSLNTYTFYNLSSKNLVFDLSTGLSYDYLDNGVQKDPRAVIRNGKIYVTAYAVCKYYDLDYSYIASAGYGYPMVRIKSKDSPLASDTDFINAASSSSLFYVLDEYKKKVAAQEAVPTPSPTPSRGIISEPGEGDRSNVDFQLALRFETGEAGAAVLDALAAEGRTAAIFFPPEQLAAQDDLVRRAVGEGHAVGLLIPGGSAEEAEAAIQEGNRILSHVARVRTRLVLPDGGDAALVEALRGKGWLCWTGNVDGLPAGRTGYAFAADIMGRAAEKKPLAQVTMDDSATSAAGLAIVLRTVRQEKYSYRPVAETDL